MKVRKKTLARTALAVWAVYGAAVLCSGDIPAADYALTWLTLMLNLFSRAVED